MLNFICRSARLLLALRYRVRFSGLETIASRSDGHGILFLPTHPALIDPVILLSKLYPTFHCHVLGDEDQVSRPVIRWWAKRFGVIPLPDAARYGAAVSDRVRKSLAECARRLAAGENILLYPAGHILRTRKEQIGGNSAVDLMLKAAPTTRVVLIRTRGLWGSAFSRANGAYPDIPRVLRKTLKTLLINAVFFMPRRPVEITVWEPPDFPGQGSRREINTFIEEFFNDQAPHNTFVPYSHWDRHGIRNMPEPQTRKPDINPSRIPAAVNRMVTEQLHQLTGRKDITLNQHLSDDLGLDSLSRLELVVWIEQEFGFQVSNPDMLETVMDVCAAATGEALAGRVDHLNPVPARWFKQSRLRQDTTPRLPETGTLTAAFLQQAAAHPDTPILADQQTGVKTYRDIITALHVLKPILSSLPGDRLGIMLPATPTASIVYLATLFAGKTPVMFNWTVGERQIDYMRELLEIQSILTARRLTAKLLSQGVCFGSAEQAFTYLEDLAAAVPLHSKLLAKFKSYLPWRQDLPPAESGDPAVILFTSGSESLPKAVPLTHANILANLRDILAIKAVRSDDILIGFLPPFHSFGLTLTVILPLLTGIKTVYHPNPTEGAALAGLIRHYRASLLPGTPTFLNGILKGARKDDLASLRIAVTGAEKCPESVYDGLQKTVPDLVILEGYGITECSPVVSVNRPERPIPFSIGRIMDSLDYRIVDENGAATCPPDQPGMLLVRGPSVFNGYWHHQGASPFVEFEGQSYYRTGDLVTEDENGILFFKGRLKRFVKRGGEMISLPAIEDVLNRHYRSENDEGPILAVESVNEQSPEITLFTPLDVSREEANQVIRQAGLSSLHNIRAIVKVAEIPILGTGKIDYRALKTDS